MAISTTIVNQITQILDSAASEGRNTLYEFEVYEILNAIGLEVPEYVIIKDASGLNSMILDKFGKSLVLKVVSPDIAHKQKVGGVQVIAGATVKNVRGAMMEMEKKIQAYYEGNPKPQIKGYLLVEFIPFTPALGHEVMFGFKQDNAFGPVLTLTKGGDDAEFFAKYYDPANLMLPPLSRDEAFRIAKSLNISHKFESIGHTEYIQYIATVVRVLSRLAYTFSEISGEKTKYVISEMDINPFVIAKDQRFIAVDGFAKFERREGDISVRQARSENLAKFFKPKGIAVIGVSADLSKPNIAREIVLLMQRLGRDDLYPVNGRGGAMMLEGKNYTFYKSLNEIERQVDLVVYAAPARYMIDFLRAMPEDGPKSVILISGIPSDVKYSEFAALLDATLPEGLRIIGPNCMGVFYGPDQSNQGVNTLFISENKLEVKSTDSSNTVLLTQSGALAVTLIDKLGKSCIFKSVVSFGNKYDVNMTDLITYFSGESNVDVISLYLEGFDNGEGRKFFELAKTVKKPIIVYKSGKTEAGARAAASHTASISGSYDTFKAACEQSGVILAEKIEDHMDFIKIFSLCAHKKLSGNRIAAVFNAGFESTVSADELGGLKQARLSANTIKKLTKADKLGLVDLSTSFLDITPSADDEMYADFVETVLRDRNVDCVFVATVPHPVTLKTDPVNCRDTDSLASRLVAMGQKYDKPIVVSVNAGKYYQEFISVMEEGGLPVYRDVRSAVKSLDRFTRYNIKKEKKR